MKTNQTIPIFDRVVSVFSNVRDTEPLEMKLIEFLALGHLYKEQIKRLRYCSDKEVRNYYKKQLPMMTTSGVFRGGRKADCLVAHSGLICIDIDEDDNTGIPDFEYLKENVLSRIEEVAYAARSVGGAGYFAIIPLKYPSQHKRQFKKLQEQFAELGITIDAACSDVCRLRCLSYDEAPYINEGAVAYTGVYKEPRQPQWQSWQRNGFADDTETTMRIGSQSVSRWRLWVKLDGNTSTLSVAKARSINPGRQSRSSRVSCDLAPMAIA